jgi:hypothetical protein
VVVWVFQDGHLADSWASPSTGFLEPTNLILMLAVLFGLSTDYEVFLLSRIREEWDRTGDNTEAVATGLQRTGGIITAAALLLIVVVSGFATGGVTTIKMLGIGTVVAVAVDAALVRTLLVPATMRLLGRWNWWAPGRSAGSTAATACARRAPTPAGERGGRVTSSRPSGSTSGRGPTTTPERVFDIYSRWEVARWLGATPRALVEPDEAHAAVDRWAGRSTEDGRFGVWASACAPAGSRSGRCFWSPWATAARSRSAGTCTRLVGPRATRPRPPGAPIGHGFARRADRDLRRRAAGQRAVRSAVCRRLGMAALGRTDRWYGTELEAYRMVRPE